MFRYYVKKILIRVPGEFIATNDYDAGARLEILIGSIGDLER